MQAKSTGFKWFTKWTRTIQRMDDHEKAYQLMMAIIGYGTDGTEPDASLWCYEFWSLYKDDIDNYRTYTEQRKEAGRRGGRPRSSSSVIDDEKGDLSNEKGIERSVKGIERSAFQEKRSDERPLHTIPNQSIPNQSIPKEIGSFSGENDDPLSVENVDNSDVDVDNSTERGAIPYSEIIDILNEATGKSYRASTEKTRRLIHARWEEGFRLDDFRKVCESKSGEWLGTDMERYLRPETLFGTKFEGYLNAADGPATSEPPEDEDPAPYDEAIGYLNRTTGQHFDPDDETVRAPVRALLSQGYTVSDMKRVVEDRIDAWEGTEWERYLRPQTVFGGKFPCYLDNVPQWKRKVLAKDREMGTAQEETA